MKLISADVNWHEGFENKPTLMLTVDKMPNNDSFVYSTKKSGGSTLYWSENEGVVHFFAHSPSNESGYAGREFTLQLTNGGSKTIKGPWSSRAGAMNAYFPHCVDVTIKETEGKFPNLGYASAISIELAHEVAELAGVKLLKENRYEADVVYEVHRLLSHASEMLDPEANR